MFPSVLRQPVQYLGETVNVSGNMDTYLVQQMHALAISISQAKERNDKATVVALLERFTDLANQYRARGDADLTGTDRFILATGKWIQDSVTVLPSAISALPQAIGSGIFRAALPFALMYLGFIALRRVR